MAFTFVKFSSKNLLLCISFLCLSTYFRLAEGGILKGDKPLNELKPSFLSLSYNVSGPVSAPAGAPVHCTDSNEWTNPLFIQQDCEDAVNKIFGWDVRIYGDIKLEFVGPGTTPSGRLPFMQTPRGYRSRSCTMAVVMLDLFGPGKVPGTGPGPFPTTGISNLREAFTAATNTLYHCVQGKKQVGWSGFGKQQSFS